MMKTMSFAATLGLLFFVLAFNMACKKDSAVNQNQTTDFRNYKLFNYSSGTEVEAGNFKIEQLLSGNARLTITLNEPFRQSNVGFEAVINTKNEGGDELVFADLGVLNGSTGVLVVNPVVASGSNLPIKFSELISRSSYYVKIMNGANVQAVGNIQ